MEEERISVRGWRTTYHGARIKNGVSRRGDEEKRISASRCEEHILARGWRTMYFAARVKNDVSRRFYGQYTTSIRRNKRRYSSRQDTLFFSIFAARYIVIHPHAEIRRYHSCPARYIVILLPLSRRYNDNLRNKYWYFAFVFFLFFQFVDVFINLLYK